MTRSLGSALAATLAAALVAALTLGLGAGAHAQDEVAAAIARARAAEAAGDARGAREAWQSIVEARPGSRMATRARDRVAWIDERGEGDLVPLGALLRYRALPRASRDAEAVAVFEREVDAMPAGLVRRESRLSLTEDWIRLEDSVRTRATAEAWLAEPELSATEERLAREALARALALEGRDADALSLLEESGLEHRSVGTALARARLEETTRPVAYALLAVFALLAGLASLLALRREGLAALRAAYRPARVVLAAWVALGPVALATFYDEEATDTFTYLAAGTLVVAALAALAAHGTDDGRARAGLVVAAVAAELALAWLVLLGSGGLVSFV